jgi:hypothetical protein
MAKTKVVLQVPQGDFDVEKVSEKAYKDCVKKCPNEVKDFNVYVKPEDGKAYYTANKGKFTGDIDI